MPTYQYACTACSEQFEVVQKFTDDALTECPTCSGALRKVFSAVGIVFKGSGFYRNDSRATSGSSASAGKSESKNGSGAGESKSDSKGESKSETKTESKSESKSGSKTDSAKPAVAASPS